MFVKLTFLLIFLFVSSVASDAQETVNGTIRVLPSSVIIGKAVKLLKPPFPSGCRCKFSKDKKIIVQFTVDEKGNVEEANGVSGHPLLRAASVIVIRNSKFSISLNKGIPVKAYGIIVYDFVLRKKVGNLVS